MSKTSKVTNMQLGDIRGAIFDVDDTLLNNFPYGDGVSLHNRSRLEATREVGRRHGSAGLQALTLKQADDAFIQAKEHSLRGAVWQMMFMAGEARTEDIEVDHPVLTEIIEHKERVHEHLLRTEGVEIAGAAKFVRLLYQRLGEKMAIASTANIRDISIFLEIAALADIFPIERIISREHLEQPKPHPEAYQKAFALLGLPDNARSHVVAFEDDPRGVLSAKSAGLFVCAIAGQRYSKEMLENLDTAPDLVAETYADFAKIFGLDW